MDRFLRSPDLRNVLYESAGGRCQSCGVQLEKGWHADHVMPWAVSQRTNVHEMQALCPNCNTRKGSKMRGFRFDVDLSEFRVHQRRAYDTIVDRIRDGEKTTGIVLPPRYGNSDVMRMSAARLIADAHISRAFFITPNVVLTAQLINNRKVQDMATRYRLGPSAPITTALIENRPPHPFPNVHFAAMNIQLAQANMSFFAQLVKQTIHETGLAPAVFFDEAHTASEDNAWGRCVKQWHGAGAYVVALTATPYRTDKGRLPGFRYRAVSNEPVTIRRPIGGNKVEISEGTAQLYQLEADCEVGFRQVWDDEPTPVLCKVTHQPLEVNLTQVDGLSRLPKGARRLSELPQEATRATLSAAVKDVGVVREACQKLVTELTNRKKDDDRTAAIVFVGNDSPGDEEDNQHAKNVEAALRELADFQVVRATSADAQADKTIQRFIDGDGDVLVVKQMGGVGLDIDRLKVCLDLSSIRTRNYFIQRLTRICTVWDRTGKPEDMITAALYISPADCLSEALFQALVRDQGGEARETDLQGIRTEAIGYREPDPPPDIYEPTGTQDADFRDSDELTAPGEQLPVVDRIMSIFYELTGKLSKPDAAHRITEAGLRFEEPTDPNTEVPENGRGPAFRNVGEELKEKRKKANATALQLATQQSGGKPSSLEWQQEIAQIWVRHKDRVFGRQVDLNTITDPAEWDRLNRSLEAQLKEEER